MNGVCMQNQYIILSLRKACPPGYKDPPKCVRALSCESNPCNAGEFCTDTTAGQHTCTCNDPSQCECTAPAVTGGKVTVDGTTVAAGGDIPNGKDFKLECDVGFFATPAQQATADRKCSLGVISPTGPFECKQADPVFDGYFVVSHAETVVPDCNVFFTNPSTDNFPQSSVPQFQQQLTFIQELESEHVYAEDALIRFGVFNNINNFGIPGSPRANFVRRNLLEQDTTPLGTLFASVDFEYTCYGDQDFTGIYQFLVSDAFRTNGRSNPNFIYFFSPDSTLGTPFAQTIQALNTIESDLQKTVYVFVVSTKARGTSDFTGLENWAASTFDDSYTFTGSNKPRGRFVGTTQESVGVLLTELRTHYGQVQF